MLGLKGKNAIVTGAGGAIGAAICRRFASEGVNLALFDINRDAAHAVSEGLSGIRTSVQAVDIAEFDAVVEAVDAAEQAIGPMDILVNNAGWDKFANFLETEPSLWEKIIGINLNGPINMHYTVLTKMSERGSGTVINISSDAGRVGSSGEAVYSACKGGIVAFTKTLAREMARSGIRLNTVCPGPTETPLFQSFLGEGEAGQKIYHALERSVPLKRLGQPEDMPGIVAFLASDDAAYITGQVISVSGGLTMQG